ncbi:MAG TPA: cadmium resistance transporter, partial [Promineifilum sp.]
VGGLLAQGLAGRWSGLLGLLPILIGFRELVERRQRPREREIPAIETGSDKSAGWRRALTIAVVTVANGGDNIGVYVPLFTRHSAVEITLLLIVFAVMLGVWLSGMYYLARHSAWSLRLQRAGQAIFPYALIVLGATILAEQPISLT